MKFSMFFFFKWHKSFEALDNFDLQSKHTESIIES